MENSSYKSNNVENRSTTTWTKRKIIKNDDLANLEKLITLDNVDTNGFVKIQETNCECQGACQSNCTGDCKGGCQSSCTMWCADNCTGGCKGGCKGGCAGGCKAFNQG